MSPEKVGHRKNNQQEFTMRKEIKQVTDGGETER
jgi:hypothetical protein